MAPRSIGQSVVRERPGAPTKPDKCVRFANREREANPAQLLGGDLPRAPNHRTGTLTKRQIPNDKTQMPAPVTTQDRTRDVQDSTPIPALRGPFFQQIFDSHDHPDDAENLIYRCERLNMDMAPPPLEEIAVTRLGALDARNRICLWARIETTLRLMRNSS